MASRKYDEPVDVSEYDKALPNHEKPVKVGHFSKDGRGEYLDDDSEKRYFKLDAVYNEVTDKLKAPLDLGLDPEKYVPFREEPWSKPNLLPWIRDYKDDVWDEDGRRLNADFVLTGRTFKTVMITPYISNIQKFDVYQLNGTFYVNAKDILNEDVHGKSLATPVRGNLGHKFEMYVTSPNLDDQPKPGGEVNENRQFYHVLQSKLGEHKLLYSVNVDCVDVKKWGGDLQEERVELCIRKGPVGRITSFAFKRYKMLEFWCKSFIADTERVICGFRDDEFMVQDIKVLKTKSLPAAAAVKIKKPTRWLPNVCVNFADHFFTYVKSLKLEPETLYEVKYNVSAGYFMHDKKGERDEQFVPDWFCQEISKKV